jgi:hypothetical protein
MTRESRFVILQISCALLVKRYLPNAPKSLADDLFKELIHLASISPTHRSGASIEENEHSVGRLLSVMESKKCQNSDLAKALIQKVVEIYPVN